MTEAKKLSEYEDSRRDALAEAILELLQGEGLGVIRDVLHRVGVMALLAVTANNE